MDKVKKVFNFEVKQIGIEEDRTLGFTGSTETEDRDGDIIEAYGWDLTDYNKNPVIMGFHEYDKFPYAKSINTYIDYQSKALKFEVKFPTISELTSFPGNADMIAEHAKNVDMAYNMYKNGYMNAVSVGFIGKEAEPMQDEKGNYKGRRYKKQSLLELSLVPVPSNPTALMEARSKGFISEKELILLETKSVVPYKKYSLAPEGEAWDGPREIASASVEDLKIMSTWYDAENSENKGAYKLPHHKADGYSTVWRGVAAAMAALLGARGGVQIPESDRRGVYNHLAKHYKDFDKEPPEYKSYDEAELKSIFGIEEKAGAAISSKNREMMMQAMEHMQMAMDMMSEMMAGKPEEPMEPMDEGCKPKPKSEEMEEIKQALDEIKSQVLLLCPKPEQKDANKVDIDLDAIEFPKVEKDAAQNELEIKPEELKQLIIETINNQIKGGN